MGVLDDKWLKNKDVFGSLYLKLGVALKDVDGLPDDMDCPETETQIENTEYYANRISNILCDMQDCSDNLFIKEDQKRIMDDISDEMGNTRDWYDETTHSRGDF